MVWDILRNFLLDLYCLQKIQVLPNEIFHCEWNFFSYFEKVSENHKLSLSMKQIVTETPPNSANNQIWTKKTLLLWQNGILRSYFHVWSSIINDLIGLFVIQGSLGRNSSFSSTNVFHAQWCCIRFYILAYQYLNSLPKSLNRSSRAIIIMS